MKKFMLLTLAFTLTVLGLGAAFNNSTAEAVTGSQWNAGRIIDDSVFSNRFSMSAADIQAFLNAKVPTCDTNGTQIYSGSQTRAQRGTAAGYPPPYTCLKSYSQDTPSKAGEAGLCSAYTGGTKSAAQIIFDVSQSCELNPQAMLVLLQKEQSLVTDDWPWSIQYRSATGYGCPDTAPCDAEYYGFFNQVYNAARQFKRYARDASSFNYRPFRSSYIQYNPNAGCGGTNVYIENQATAGLYNYTPYQPNASALNNLYGSGDSCGAYGNRNFWRMFNDWFGSTIGPAYQWSIEWFGLAGGDNNISVGETETLTLRARNTGRNPWYNGGPNPVRIGIWNDSGSSPLYKAGSWYSPGRPATLTESMVSPGEVGTFTFQITPSSVGSYVLPMNLVAENAIWAPWPGFSPTINVNNGYAWNIDEVIYDLGGGIMEQGQTQWITVKARNVGNVTWSKSTGPPIFMGYYSGGSSPVATNWLSPTRATLMNENTVEPGEVAGFQFQVRTPGFGNFYTRLNMVAEGVTWFNDAGLTLYLRGGVYSWEPVWTSLSTGNANIGRNQTFDITIRARNTGDLVWRRGGNFPVRLGNAAPNNRGSALEYTSWLSSIRPTGLVESSVPPGGEGTFTFTARSPASPGPRVERFNLIAEGATWLNDVGLGIYINSL